VLTSVAFLRTNNILHKNIHLRNILIDPKNLRTKLDDLAYGIIDCLAPRKLSCFDSPEKYD